MNKKALSALAISILLRSFGLIPRRLRRFLALPLIPRCLQRGFLLGVIAVFLTNRYISNKEKKIYEGLQMATVIAAFQDIPAGAPIASEMFAPRNVPQKYIHGNAIAANDFNRVVGETLNYPLKRGDTLLWSDLGKKDRRAWRELADRVTKGERALSITVDSTGGVSGFLRPNDRIDLLGTFRSKETGQEATLTLLQNMTILATGNSMAGMAASPGSYGTITLLVTLKEAELLIFAQRQGQLIAALRNPEDLETFEDIPKVNFSNIMKPDFRDKIQKKRNAIEVIKQGKVSEK